MTQLTLVDRSKLRLWLAERTLGITISEATARLNPSERESPVSEEEVGKFFSANGKAAVVLPNGDIAFAHPSHPIFSAPKRTSNRLKLKAVARRKKPHQTTTFVNETARKYE